MHRSAIARGVRAALACTYLSIALLATTPSQAQTVAFDLPAQDATTGIPEFARQAGLQIIAPVDNLKGIKTHQVVGTMDAHEALRRLLEGTGLTVASDDGHTISLRLPNKSTTDAASSEGAPLIAIEEVIVTAQKKEERLQDVPIPVTVLDANALAVNNQTRLRDYFSAVPGFNATPNYASQLNLAIRGVATGGNNTPTVGVTIDDIPYGASFGPYGNHAPDIDPGDLARIEVLRGPQGTLYGANSMGGLVKFVTTDPSFNTYTGRIEAGTSAVHNGSDNGFNLRGSANLPVSDTLAFRVSAFRRDDPGYIDNPVFHLKDVNELRSSGARVTMLWKPSEVTSLKVSALYQSDRTFALDEVDVPGLQQDYLAGSGGTSNKAQAYSAIFKTKLGRAELISLTGYNVLSESDGFDATFLLSPLAQIFGPTVTGAPVYEETHVRKFVQELRLSIPLGERIDWLLGGFYTHEKVKGFFDVQAEDPATGQFFGSLWHFGESNGPSEFEELAAFTDVTYRFNEQWDIQLGARESHLQTDLGEIVQTGPLVGGGPVIAPAIDSSAHAFTYLVTPRFKLLPDVMIYARFASGYRPGLPNNPGTDIPRQVNPDRTKNYEIGIKAELMDRRLSVDASVFRIDWENIQIEGRDVTNLTFNTNGSGAKSEGVELAVAARPFTGFTANGWVAYDNAKLTEDLPTSTSLFGAAPYALSGERLPMSSRYSANANLQQEFPLSPNVTGFVGAQASYVGQRLGIFGKVAARERQSYPAYTKTDLRVGVRTGSWTVSGYVNNLTDKRALVNGGIGYFYPPANIYIRPRTVGLSVVKTFE